MSTKIEWCDEVWNPITGCSHAGTPGCDNCYAARMVKRLAGRHGYPKKDPFRPTLHGDRLELPLRWRQRRRIFVNSMGDLFHPLVPDSWLDLIFSSICIHWPMTHIFMALTKRPQRMRDYFKNRDFPVCDNLWLGATAENQAAADERIPLLLDTPAAVRFVSVEPMLGPVDLVAARTTAVQNGATGSLQWVICGGETGPKARPIYPGWVRNLRDQCRGAKVPFFFKGWGEWGGYLYGGRGREEFNWCERGENSQWMCRVGKKESGRFLDGKEYNEIPW